MTKLDSLFLYNINQKAIIDTLAHLYSRKRVLLFTVEVSRPFHSRRTTVNSAVRGVTTVAYTILWQAGGAEWRRFVGV
jgi:hypothetical protein